MDYDYTNDIKINPDALDVEWLRQPELYMKYCEAAANAKRAAATAMEKIKVIRSQLIKEAREEGLAKNAGQEEAYYRDHVSHKRAKAEWIEKEHVAAILHSAVFAFNQRKDALENLVRLAGQGYFATPEVPRDLPHEYGKVTHSPVRTTLADQKRRKGRVR